MADPINYAVRFSVDYQEHHDRLTSFFRPLLAIPIFVILTLLSGSSGGGGAAGIAVATLLMILFRQRYPKWWFDFQVELARFSARVSAYTFLLADTYPSTTEAQSVHLEVDYPDATQLNRWLPLVKWFLAIPHIIILMVLAIVAIFFTILAWFAILFTGRYPKPMFDFVVGVGRWSMRVWAYAFILVTDEYPPFSLN